MSNNVTGVQSVEPLLPFEGDAMLAEFVVKAIAGDLDEKGLKTSEIGKMPGARAVAAQKIGPHRLHDVDGVEFGLEPRRHLPADDLAQIRLARHERRV